MSTAKIFELRVTLDNGKSARIYVPLHIDRRLLESAGLQPEGLIKHRLYDAYLALEHFLEPMGPAMPEELKDI